MTNKITLSRELVGNLVKALQVFTGHDSGPNLRHTYGNEWWEPIDAMREDLRAALADPVPPAGGKPEELAPDAAKAMQAAHNSCPLQLSGMDRMAWIADHFQRWYVCSAKPSITDALQKRIKELVGIHGSLRAVARHTGIDVGYLSRLDSGERDNPSVEVLSMLGVAVLDNGAHATRLQAEVLRLRSLLDSEDFNHGDS